MLKNLPAKYANSAERLDYMQGRSDIQTGLPNKKMTDLAHPPTLRRRTMSWALLRAINGRHDGGCVSIGGFLAELGDRSFGWSILLFSIINLLPMPFGSTMITAIPVILITAQMALGFSHIRLPGFINRRPISRAGLRRVVIRLRPMVRPIERIIRPRYVWLFQPNAERLMGLLLLAVAIALFLPLPLSGWIPAFALFVSAFGLVERDGLVTMIGLGFGVASIVITIVVAVSLAAGAAAFF